MTKHFIRLVSVVGVGCSFAEAAILANYNFESSSVPLNSVDEDAGSTAGPMVRSATANTGRSTADSLPNYFIRTLVTPDSESAALTGPTFSFTVTPAAGMVLNLERLNVKTAAVAGSDFSFNGTIFIRSSIDNFAANLGSYTQDSTTSSTSSSYSQREILLDGAAFQNLASAVTFRLYFYDNSNTPTSDDGAGTPFNTGVVHRIDDLILSGTAVPEPASMMIVAVSGLALGLRRRR